MYGIIFEQILFFLLLFVSVWLGDGKQSVVDVFLAIGILILLVIRGLKRKDITQLPGRVTIVWAVLFLYFAVMTVFSDSVSYSVSSAIRWVMAYLVFLLFYSERRESKYGEKFSSLLLWFGALTALSSVVVTAYEPAGLSLSVMNLLYPATGHNHIANILVLVLPIAFSRLIERRDRISAFLVAFFSFALLFSFARGAWMLIVFYLFCLLVFNWKQMGRIKVVIVGIAIDLTALLVFGSTVKTAPSGMFQSQLFTRQIVKQSILADRLPYWKQAIAAFWEHPWFGTGPGTFSILSKRFQEIPNGYSWFAHSFPLELLAELGLVGLFLIIILGFTLRREIVNHVKQNSALEHGIVLTLVYSVYEMNLNFLVIWLLFWATIGVASSHHDR